MTSIGYSNYNAVSTASLLGTPQKPAASAIPPILSPVKPVSPINQSGAVKLPSSLVTLLQAFAPGSDSVSQLNGLTGNINSGNNFSSAIANASFQKTVRIAYQAAAERNAQLAAPLPSGNSAAAAQQNKFTLDEAKRTLADIRANPLVA